MLLSFSLFATPDSLGLNTDTGLPVIDPNDPTSISKYWAALYAILMPFGNWLLAILWKSNTKKDLTLKTASFAIVILIVIISFKGINVSVIIQALVAFVGQAFFYDKVYNPSGLNSPAVYKATTTTE